MSMEKLKVRLTGTRPLLMHNGQLVDPLNPFAKAIAEISKKRGKTEEDILELRKREWHGGLYKDRAGRIALPENALLGAVVEGARDVKLGKKAESGVVCLEAFFPLEYTGSKNPEKLYEDPAFVDVRDVVIGKSKVMRTRPIFVDWAVTGEFLVQTDVIDVEAVVTALVTAGHRKGLGDFRPRYGRFEVAVV